MKTKFAVLLSATFITVLIIISCSKNVNSPLDVSKEKLVGKYLLTALTQQDGTKTIDLFTNPDQSEKYNVQVLHADMTYNLGQHSKTTDATSAHYGIWNIAANKLTLDGVIFTIQTFNEHKMVLRTTFTFEPVTKTVTATYTRQ